MQKKIDSFFLFVLVGLLSYSQQSKTALFVGNSYTAGNNLAQITSDIATSTGNTLIFDEHTLGGQRFINHAENPDLSIKINSQDWDYVTLQGQSVEVALTGPVFDNEVAPYASQLVQNIRLNNECTQPVFFRTWGRENGFSSPDCDPFPWMCSYEGMDDALAQNYQILAEQNHALIAPVGAVWRYLRTYHPDLDLYTSDSSHPSQIGSYAAAVTFNTIFFNTDPLTINYNYTLSDIDANTIKNAVNIVLYQVMADFDFTAFFDYSISNTTVSFVFDNFGADTYHWDFGDGNTSTIQQPTHSFNSVGEYLVNLTITKCGRQHTYSKLIPVTGLNTIDVDFNSIKIYPNPTYGIVNIKGLVESVDVDVFDGLGKRIKSVKRVQKSFSLSDLECGFYFIKIYNGSNSRIFKVLLQ
ncbi:PKD domain-containing protein [Psychroserpens sp. XS_ASV72]|uniref:PKD domain-containing protein n=1 Tax=Psychroserpens sp. XS_ASV72 TaxID=3241293 RepID=UPI0035135CCE